MVSRRLFMMGLPLALAACTTTRGPVDAGPRVDPTYLSMYGDQPNEPFPVAPVDIRRIDPRFWRQEVDYFGSEAPGTIVVNTTDHFLYLVGPGGRAMRYGVGVGREEGLNFRGNATIGRKAEWPRWTPTANMIRTQPDRYKAYAAGMPGGPNNPLGPRALYLYRGGADTHFRLHGTLEPYTIGGNVSSGCIRLINQDIIDLYNRVPSGTRVVVVS